MSRHVGTIARPALESHLHHLPQSARLKNTGPGLELSRCSFRPVRRSKFSTGNLIGSAREFGTAQHVTNVHTRSPGFASRGLARPQIGLGRRDQDSIVPSPHTTLDRGLFRWKQLGRSFGDKKTTDTRTTEPRTQNAGAKPPKPAERQASAASHSANRKLLYRLPHLHRPTKDELLAAATGFWQRLGIRFKWFSIRSFRPFNHDEIGAFISWILYAHILWIVIGTTTFLSALIWALNTVVAQETLAGWVGNYLTRSSGLKVVFESAIVPTWRDGVITFRNVFVSRRPGPVNKKKRSVSKGSSTTAAAAAEAAMAERQNELAAADDGNYSQFDVTIATVNVTLSFAKWFNGKGFLRDVEIKGVRGVIDRTHLQHSSNDVDPKTYRHEHTTGDFEIDHFRMDDVLLTVYQPDDFRPFTISVFNCELPRLRKQWLFYDFMSANNMSGSFDNSLFTVHPRQAQSHNSLESGDGDSGAWKKHTRLRIDGLNIDHLNRGVDGPFSWIYEGNVDIVADVLIPNDEDGIWQRSTKAMSDFYNQIVEKQVHRLSDTTIHHDDHSDTVGHHSNSTRALDARQSDEEDDATSHFLVFDIHTQLNDVRASVPIFAKDLSYVNNALVRPIVAYINSRHGAFIPINCRVVKRQSEFDGSWTIFDSGLLDDLSREVYEAFARDIVDAQRRRRRFRKVGWWTLQLAVQALFIGLAGQLA